MHHPTYLHFHQQCSQKHKTWRHLWKLRLEKIRCWRGKRWSTTEMNSPVRATTRCPKTPADQIARAQSGVRRSVTISLGADGQNLPDFRTPSWKCDQLTKYTRTHRVPRRLKEPLSPGTTVIRVYYLCECRAQAAAHFISALGQDHFRKETTKHFMRKNGNSGHEPKCRSIKRQVHGAHGKSW